MIDKPTTRAVLPLLKCPVTDLGPNHLTIAIGAEYGSPTTIRLSLNTALYDIRLGDIQTIYTEVLLKPAAGAA